MKLLEFFLESFEPKYMTFTMDDLRALVPMNEPYMWLWHGAEVANLKAVQQGYKMELRLDLKRDFIDGTSIENASMYSLKGSAGPTLLAHRVIVEHAGVTKVLKDRSA